MRDRGGRERESHGRGETDGKDGQADTMTTSLTATFKVFELLLFSTAFMVPVNTSHHRETWVEELGSPVSNERWEEGQ